MASQEPTVNALARGLDILALLAQSDVPLTLGEVAAALEIKSTTAHNLLQTLCVKGAVIKERRNTYGLAEGLGRYGFRSSREAFLSKLKSVLLALQEALPYSIVTWADVGPLGVEKWCAARASRGSTRDGARFEGRSFARSRFWAPRGSLYGGSSFLMGC